MTKYFTRMGDGSPIEMTEDEIRRDIDDGVAQAVKNGDVPPLPKEEI
jgi:hypothetical protein